jgi:hypothetical protein
MAIAYRRRELLAEADALELRQGPAAKVAS